MAQKTGCVPWNKGKKGCFSKETLQLMSKKRLGKKSPHSEQTKIKMSLASKGKPKSDKHKQSLKEMMYKRYKDGFVSPFKKIWEDNPLYLTGENNQNWKGGISKIDKSVRRMPQYFQWRSDVFERDNWTCQTCGIRGVYVTAHHVDSFSGIIKRNSIKTRKDAVLCKALWDTNNGVTLCEDCHKLTDNYKGRGITKKLTKIK